MPALQMRAGVFGVQEGALPMDSRAKKANYVVTVLRR
jgi:hypothetical protein